MKTVIIKKKMSNTGTIYDLNNSMYNREIKFRDGTFYAVVLPSYFGSNIYKTFVSEQRAIEYAIKEWQKGYFPSIIDNEGNFYSIQNNYYGKKLVLNEHQEEY